DLILITHELIKQSFSMDEIKSSEPLWKVYQSTESFKFVYEALVKRAQPILDAYNTGKEYEDQIGISEIDALSMLITSLRDDIVKGSLNFTIQDDNLDHLQEAQRLEAQHNHLYETFKNMYRVAIGQAMATHVYLLSLDVPEDKDIPSWEEKIEKTLITTYCDTAPNGLKDPSPDKDFETKNDTVLEHYSCSSMAEAVLQTNYFRPMYKIDQVANEINQGIEKANEALGQVISTKLSESADVHQAKYETTYLEMFSKKSGVLLLTDTLQGVQPFHVFGDSYDDEQKRKEQSVIEQAVASVKKIAEFSHWAYTGMTDLVKREFGKEETLQAMDMIQHEAVNPLYNLNQILNPDGYSPPVYLNHNEQETSSKEGLARLRLAIKEAIDETQKGITELHMLLQEYGKKYASDQNVKRNTLRGKAQTVIETAMFREVNADLEDAIEEMILYYPSAAIVVAKSNPTMVSTIIKSMVKATIAQRKKEKRVQTIGTVMLVAAGVLILTGVGSGIGAGLAGAASASFMMVAHTALGVGMVLGAADAIYSGHGAFEAFRHYEKIKASTYTGLRKSHPNSFREEYKKYLGQLGMAIVAGVFSAVDLAALKNLKNIQKFVASAKPRARRNVQAVQGSHVQSVAPLRTPEQIEVTKKYIIDEARELRKIPETYATEAEKRAFAISRAERKLRSLGLEEKEIDELVIDLFPDTNASYAIGGSSVSQKSTDKLIKNAQELAEKEFGTDYKVVAYDEQWSSVLVAKPNGKFQKAYYHDAEASRVIEFEGKEFDSVELNQVQWSMVGKRVVRKSTFNDTQAFIIKSDPYQIELNIDRRVITIDQNDMSKEWFDEALVAERIGAKVHKEGLLVWFDENFILVDQANQVMRGVRSGSDMIFTSASGQRRVLSVADNSILDVDAQKWGRSLEWKVINSKSDPSDFNLPSSIDDQVPASGYGEINCTGHSFGADAFLARSKVGNACALDDSFFEATVRGQDADGMLPTKSVKEAESYYGATSQRFFKPDALHNRLLSMEDGGTAIVIVPPNPPRIKTGHMFNARKEGERVVYYDFQKRVVTDNIEVYFNVGSLDRSDKAAYIIETTQFHKRMREGVEPVTGSSPMQSSGSDHASQAPTALHGNSEAASSSGKFYTDPKAIKRIEDKIINGEPLHPSEEKLIHMVKITESLAPRMELLFDSMRTIEKELDGYTEIIDNLLTSFRSKGLPENI
ncbi:MAG: hypothetical protein KDD46_05950, partial [Bdellovibrionales bacterium]|nr:hypothetical protein [Bdellovibrionales bacterium]